MQSEYAILHGRLWPVRLYHMFSHSPISSTILGEKNIENKVFFKFIYKFSPKYFSF